MTTIFFVFMFSFICNAQTTIQIVKMENFDPIDKKRIENITAKTEKLINSEFFKEAIIEQKDKNAQKFIENKGLSNLEIYSSIMNASEDINSISDKTWQLNLSLKRIFSSSTLAYTEKSKPEIFINLKYFKNAKDNKIAGTICHEYMHKLGYAHDKKYSKERSKTVPYMIGDICDSLYLNLKSLDIPSQPKTQEKKICGFLCKFKKVINVNP